MSWTYDTTFVTNLPRVRLLIGDTDTTDQKLQDEEINFTLTTDTNIYIVAALCCRAIAGKYAPQADASVGGIRESSSQRFAHYTQLAIKYENKAKRNPSADNIWLSGISLSEMEGVNEDSDRVPSRFQMGQFDFLHNAQEPTTANQNY